MNGRDDEEEVDRQEEEDESEAEAVAAAVESVALEVVGGIERDDDALWW